MRKTFAPLALALLSMSLGGCFLDRAGTLMGCTVDVAPVCNALGGALEGCAASVPTSTDCSIGCTPGADFCWDCDPSDTTLTCNAAGEALEGCGADGLANVDNCLTGCTPGDSQCGPCMTGAIVCDGADLVTCVMEMEEREICDFACLPTPAPPHCTACTPGASECHGVGAGSSAVECAADGTIASSDDCAIGCSLVAGTATCQACVPGSSRCSAASDAILDCDGAGVEVPTPCTSGDVCSEASGTPTCVSGCVPGCTGDVLTDCSGPDVTCGFGCNTAGTACLSLLPSNVGTAVAMDAGTANLSIGTGGSQEVLVFFTEDGRIARLDTSDFSLGSDLRGAGDPGGDNGSGIYYDEVAQAGSAPDMAVWAVRSLNVGANGIIYFVGLTAGAPAAVLLVEGDVDIAGEVGSTAIFLPGEGRVYWGPSAFNGGFPGRGGAGTGGGDGGTGNDGGGGGGFGSAGGPDGSTVRLGGGTYGTPTLVPLIGGSGGGGAENGNGLGGPGGGALQISAGGTFTVSGTGIIDASGSPGSGATGHGGGGGGGSGGALLLEARSISIMGTVGSPGGGGGGGRHNSESAEWGVRWDPASGELRSRGGAASSGGGGDGADGSDLAGNTGTAGDENDDDGGGGGGSGRVRLNARSASDVTTSGGDPLTPSIASGITTTGAVSTR